MRRREKNTLQALKLAGLASLAHTYTHAQPVLGEICSAEAVGVVVVTIFICVGFCGQVVWLDSWLNLILWAFHFCQPLSFHLTHTHTTCVPNFDYIDYCTSFSIAKTNIKHK